MRIRITVIGGGNMGSAIVRGLVHGSVFRAEDITVVDISVCSLNSLQEFNSSIRISLANYDSVRESDVVLLAVKPWLVNKVIEDIKETMNYSQQILISIAASVNIADINRMLKKSKGEDLPAVFRVIPNTAIAVKRSMTLIASCNASSKQEELVLRIFSELGNAVLLDEEKISAGLAITSCGIAYCFRYIRAVVSAGVELGFYPMEVQELAVKTMLGAAVLLDENKQPTEVEIDKVTTPGGLTIKGLNQLESKGFSSAVIQAVKASVAES
ncbi:MAG: pyrroline-5-carboxylate reductase [Candidatus Azobacteroides pseudotrichonymphae]|jgi:pyrroline-5-carboxylate reductase|uniref:Pyrroline-5-carboxylate reductase n=1 Tax=Azobacteroides pseudotrichonymphae genomovar. CFP2 TaxID=511995 RepID=B6YQW5_AZOPC|nr:pyrroline-5-carboxylate reductase [Candidatus Azobacteroides pseudotrichonymphae]BAG83587.1 pyrroline-5-carboxylate reductase [Candidatus Azobacteroides pseudotrichonymphae genomovar. CFP2]GMO32493.1 MAG: pyrroline-5-carboxylate reductase [Candidatus Azobacteroides pseudotrichonymphae]